MQQISLFHLFILETQLMLESCDQTDQNLFLTMLPPPPVFLINFSIMWIYIKMQKIRLFHRFVLELGLIKKSCSLTGSEHFGPYLRNKNLVKYKVCAGTQQIIQILIIEQIQWKVMTEIFNNSKNPVFATFLVHFPNFEGKKHFHRKFSSVKHNLIWVSRTLPKFWQN